MVFRVAHLAQVEETVFFFNVFFIYLNLAEEDFVPDAVTANDPTADFSTFSFGSKVEQPTLQRTVSLAEDLQRRQRQNAHLFFFRWKTSAFIPAVKTCTIVHVNGKKMIGKLLPAPLCAGTKLQFVITHHSL